MPVWPFGGWRPSSLAMTPERLDRFARHIVLPEVGGAGQARIMAAPRRCNTWRGQAWAD
jgi:hypothetical protein